MKLMIGDKVIIDTDKIDGDTGLPIMKVVQIKSIQYVYEVCSPETPNHTFDIVGDRSIKGVLKKK